MGQPRRDTQGGRAMKHIELTDNLPVEKVLRSARKGDVVLTRRGHAVGILSKMDDEELAWCCQERDPKFLASIIRARKQVRQGQVTSQEDLKRQLGIKKAK